jgi:integrase
MLFDFGYCSDYVLTYPMATVAKDARGRSPFWYACYTSADGRRLKKSTGETAKSKALEIAIALQRAENMAHDRTLTEVRVRELLSETLQRITGEGLRVFTVKQWLDLFVKGKRKSRNEKTAARHEQMMNEFVGFLGGRAALNIAAITSKDITDFRDHREAKGLAPATVNLDIKILSAALNAAWKQGHISVNPCAAVEPLKDKATHKKVFSPEQVSALVAAADGDWKGVILTAFYTGMRLNDVCNLRWRDIDLVSKIKTITFEPRKTGGELKIVVHPALEDYLLTLSAPDSDAAFLFPTVAQRKSVSPLSKVFRAIMERAKIAQSIIRERKKLGRSVHAHSFHSLRHSFSSILANAGIAEEVRMRLTGHTTREIHQRYSHHDLEVLQSAIAVLPRIEGK